MKYSSRCTAVRIVSTSYYLLCALVTVDIYFHTLCTGSRLILIFSLEQAEARWGYKSDRNNVLEQIVMQQRQHLAEHMRPAVMYFCFPLLWRFVYIAKLNGLHMRRRTQIVWFWQCQMTRTLLKTDRMIDLPTKNLTSTTQATPLW